MSKQTENYIGSQQHWEDRINDDYDYLKQMEKKMEKDVEKLIYNGLEKRNKMSKQTAVEWLMEQITYKTDNGERHNSFIDTIDLSEYFNQAIEMDKEQKIDAFETGRRKGDWIFDGEKYYEETYKNENNV